MGRRTARRARASSTVDEAGLAAILTGLGSLSYGELAGERMKLGLMLHDPEEEHDCFSDNTHNSHYYDELGMQQRLSRHATSASTAAMMKGPSVARSRQGEVGGGRHRDRRAKLDATHGKP